VETWGLGGVNNETKIAGLIVDFASVRAGLIQKSIISPAWTDNRFFRAALYPQRTEPLPVAAPYQPR